MSIQAISWAFNQNVSSSSRKFVLIAMANFASEANEAFPTMQTVCRMTSQDIKTVGASIEELIAKGYINDTGKRLGRTQQVKVYKLNVRWEEPKPTENGDLKDTHKRVSEPIDIGTGDLLDSKEFKAAFKDWKQHRKEIGRALTPLTENRQLSKLRAMGEQRAIKAIHHSIGEGWRGIFEPDNNEKQSYGKKSANSKFSIDNPPAKGTKEYDSWLTWASKH